MISDGWNYSGVAERLKIILELVPGSNVDAKSKNLGFSAPSVYSYLSGKTRFPLEFMIKLQEITGVNLNWLLTGEGGQLLSEQEGIDKTIDIDFIKEVRDKLIGYAASKFDCFKEYPLFGFETSDFDLLLATYNALVDSYNIDTIDKGLEKIAPLLDPLLEKDAFIYDPANRDQAMSDELTPEEIMAWIERELPAWCQERQRQKAAAKRKENAPKK